MCVLVSVCVYLHFLTQSQGTWKSFVWLGWLADELQTSTCLPHLGIASWPAVQHFFFNLFWWMLRKFGPRALCLYNRHLTGWPILPVSSQQHKNQRPREGMLFDWDPFSTCLTVVPGGITYLDDSSQHSRRLLLSCFVELWYSFMEINSWEF